MTISYCVFMLGLIILSSININVYADWDGRITVPQPTIQRVHPLKDPTEESGFLPDRTTPELDPDDLPSYIWVLPPDNDTDPDPATLAENDSDTEIEFHQGNEATKVRCLKPVTAKLDRSASRPAH